MPLRVRRGSKRTASQAPQWHPSFATPPQTGRAARIVCREDAFRDRLVVAAVVVFARIDSARVTGATSSRHRVEHERTRVAGATSSRESLEHEIARVTGATSSR